MSTQDKQPTTSNNSANKGAAAARLAPQGAPFYSETIPVSRTARGSRGKTPKEDQDRDDSESVQVAAAPETPATSQPVAALSASEPDNAVISALPSDTPAVAAIAAASDWSAGLIGLGAAVLGGAAFGSGGGSGSGPVALPLPVQPVQPVQPPGSAPDKTPPTVVVTTDRGTLKAGETSTITFTFSEDPGIGFDASSVTVSGGTLGPVTGTGLTRTATFTPTAGSNDAASVHVDSDRFADAAGNNNADGADADNTVSMTVDTQLPTVAITSDHSALRAGETAAITFTFSEDPGTSFDASDIVVTGGTLGPITGTGLTRTATFTPTAGSNEPASVHVDSGKFADAARNNNADGADADNTVSMAVDTTLPTVAITSDHSVLKAGETAIITFAFSEDPGASFDGSDIVVTGGTLGALVGAGATRTAVFTPTAGSTVPASVSVASGKFADAAGNANADGADSDNCVAMTVDTVLPTVELISNVSSLKAGETATITFTFSEDPGASFDASDIVVTGGTLSAITGSGLTRTAVFTPTVGSMAGSVHVDSARFTDAADNANADGAEANNTVAFGLDTVLPTVALASDKTALKAGETAIITFSFSEDPGATFDVSDIVVIGGTLGALSGTGLTRTAVFTPSAGSTNSSIHVDSARFTDPAGNANADGADADNTVTMSLDTVPPTIVVTSDHSALKAGETATVTFTFSEDPGTSFDASDIAVSGGTLGAITGSGLTRTAVFTPTPAATSASIHVASDKFTDAAGNANVDGADADNTVTMTLDTVPPTVAVTSNMAALKSGETTTITFTFSEDPGASFDAGDIAVAGGTLGALSGSGLTRTSVFTPAAGSTLASVHVDSARFTDAAGNANADGADADNTVTIAVDTVPPTVALSSDKANLIAGQSATITFTFSEDPGASFDTSDVAVTGGTLGAIAGSGLTRTALFTPTAGATTTAVIGVGSDKFTDAAGNANADGAEANNTLSLAVDTQRPTVALSTSDGALTLNETATITFTFSEDPGTSFDASDIAVTGGTLGALSGTGLTRTAVFTPTPGSTANASVSVGSNKFADAAGNQNTDGAEADNTVSMTVDTVAPTITFTSAGDDVGSVQGNIASGRQTDDTELVLGGALSKAPPPGATVVVYDGTNKLGTATVAADGLSWSLAAGTLGQGHHQLTASVELGGTAVATSNMYDVKEQSLSSISSSSSTGTQPAMDSVRYLALRWVGGTDMYIHLGELEVMSGGVNIALNNPNIRTSIQNGNYMFNGVADSWAIQHQFEGIAYIDLGALYSIDSIRAIWPQENMQFYASAQSGMWGLSGAQLAAGNAGTIWVGNALAEHSTDVSKPDSITFTSRPRSFVGGTPSLSGTLGAALDSGETVGVYEGATRLGTATVNGTSWTFTPTTALSDGSHVIRAEVENATGALVGVRSPSTTVFITTKPPTQTAQITAVIDDSTEAAGWADAPNGTLSVGTQATIESNDKNPRLLGTLSAPLDPGMLLAIYDGTTRLGYANVTDLTWDFTTPSKNGASTLMARVENVVGNGQDSNVVNYYRNSFTFGMSDDVGTVTGNMSNNTVTDDDRPTFSGDLVSALRSGDKISIYEDGVKIGTATSSGTTWSFTPATALAAGTHAYTARLEDSAGTTVMPSSTTLNITIGSSAVPSQTVAIARISDNVGSLQGVVANGGVTDDQSPTLSGTVSAALNTGDRVAIYDGASTTPIGYATMAANGIDWSFTTPGRGWGTHSFTARVITTSGVTGTASPAYAVDVQFVSIAGAADDFGTTQGNVGAGGTTDDTTPRYSGTLGTNLQAGQKLSMYDGTVKIGEATVTGTTWTFTPATGLSIGSHGVKAVLETSAGAAVGLESGVYNLNITNLPTETVAIGNVMDDAAPNTGINVANNYTNDTTPTINGTLSGALPAGSTLKVYDNGVYLGDATVTGSNWTYTPTLGTGAHSLTARVVNSFGQGPVSGAVTLNIVTTPPTQTTVISTVTDNVGTTTGPVAQGGITDDTTLALAGTVSAALAAGTTVRVMDNGVFIGNATVSGTNWTYTASLGLGAHNLTAQVANAAGTSAETAGFAFKVQTFGAITLTDDVGLVTGPVAINGLTDDLRPRFSGSFGTALGAGEKVSIFDGATKLGEGTVTGTSWTFDPSSDLTIGTHTLMARLEDASGTPLTVSEQTKTVTFQMGGTGGDDLLDLSAANVNALIGYTGAQTLVTGLAGRDTMRLNGAGTLDLTSKPDTLLKGLEAVDLASGNGAAMTLKLNVQDVLDMTLGTDQWDSYGGIATGTHRTQLKIEGGNGDALDLDLAEWTLKGTVSNAGITYNVYDSSAALNAELLVANTVFVI